MQLTIVQTLIPTTIKIQDRDLRCKTLSKCLNVRDQVEVVSMTMVHYFFLPSTVCVWKSLKIDDSFCIYYKNLKELQSYPGL